MAEFCYDCIQRVFPEVDPRKNDLAHLAHGEVAWEVCEGCGEGWFDWQGRRVQDEERETDVPDDQAAQGGLTA